MTWYFKTKIISWNGPQQPFSQRLWSRLVWWLREESVIWKPAPFMPDFCPINKTNPWTSWQWVQCTHFNVSVTVVTKLDNLRIFVDIMLYPNIFNVKTNWIKAINKCTSSFLWIRNRVHRWQIFHRNWSRTAAYKSIPRWWVRVSSHLHTTRWGLKFWQCGSLLVPP